jgi:predicted nuclease of restriction endonuclease-like (RecB) superfamily
VPAQLPAGDQLAWQDQAWMQRLRRELSSSHLLELSRTSDPVARAFDELHARAHRWSVRELKRQRDSMLFERSGLSRDAHAVLALADAGRLLDTATATVRDPYVLEFLNLPERHAYSESDLEGALVDHLQAFLLELGGDFCLPRPAVPRDCARTKTPRRFTPPPATSITRCSSPAT